MDASALTLNAPNKKLCKRENAADGEDIISNLPENVLIHILSFLPTKDAVRTSVLSRKWEFMWTSVTNLHFDDSFLYSRRSTKKLYFMNFVDRVLLHYGNSTIQSFSLSCCSNYNSSHLNAWISAVIRRKVQRLDISLFKPPSVFPCSIFNCDSLIELKLRMSCTFKVPPTSICFSSLKILHLSRVTFLNEHFSHSRQLFFCFPVLEVFKCMECTWLNLKIINIDAPALNSLTMGYSKYQWLPDGSNDCVIKICGSSLTKFECMCSDYYDLLEDFVLPSPPSVVDATVVIHNEKGKLDRLHEMSLRACMLLRQFATVKYLSLSVGTMKVLAHAEDFLAHLPTFDMLIHLKLSQYFGDLVIGRLMEFLQSSPILESLVLNVVISPCDNDDLVLVPQCFQSHLKVVKFQSFYGEEQELYLVKFLLKNAKVLEEMNITTNGDLQYLGIDKEDLKRQLLAIPKGSSSASIVFT